ncbi:helix-turn-helix domain-containing protein [Sphingobium nicotianae]|uniref:Helix-turn-helix domain-containing protein n=1 Tax=Sphingobium nicotianae TaxID=2782607 RepID=A0A9X1DAP7_9SPHN|nr:helix-turn-helix domain-containing protein [Sphingobium nicotianae]MBT2186503.1 helix-turn-helix domain-containing protein [Sphingobium nicotianae]
MESFSTETLVRGGRTRAWNEIYSSRLSTIDFIPQSGNFSAGLKLGGLGRLGLARLMTGPCTIRRTVDHIDDGASARLYSFLIQLNGEGQFAQGKHDAVLHRGDVTLCDNGVPHCYRLGGEDAEMLLVRVPHELIRDYLPYPERLSGRRLPAQNGLAVIAAGMACSLWRQIERGLDPAHEDSIAHQLLDLFATSYSMAYGPEMSGPFPDAKLHARAAGFIEEHIRDATLTVRGVAAAVGLPVSELLAMFVQRGDSFGGYVSRRRLDQAARQLRNPRWRGSTVSGIAYGVGYTSVPLFTRAFHARFGVSPGDYRRSQLH